MDYGALIERLSHRGLFRIHPGLDRVRGVLKTLGNPQDRIPVIHIAGTNGKGSVAACLESVLRKAGYRTGLYISPHLQDVRERIQLQGLPISISRFWEIAQSVLDAEHKAKMKLTYFEFLTVMAFVAFTKDSTDIAVVETGMGGRWDATNVVKQPLLTIITSIGLDHTQWLGKTLQAVAREKAGILKSECPLVLGAIGHPAKIISALAQKLRAPTCILNKDFSVSIRAVQWHEGHQTLDYQVIKANRRQITVNLLGTYQADNVALTLAGIDVLNQKGWKITDKSIREGLAAVQWPGRFQLMHLLHGPTLLFDGAHNPDAMKQLLESIHQSPWKRTSKTFVFSAYKDKDYRQMLSMIARDADQLILCTLPGSRSLPARNIRTTLAKSDGHIEIVADPHKALHRAIQKTAKNNLIVVTGSLALVGMLLGDSSAEERSREMAAISADSQASRKETSSGILKSDLMNSTPL